MIESQYNSPIGTLTMVSDGTSLTELKFGKPKEKPNNQDLPVFVETRRRLAYGLCLGPRHQASAVEDRA